MSRLVKRSNFTLESLSSLSKINFIFCPVFSTSFFELSESMASHSLSLDNFLLFLLRTIVNFMAESSFIRRFIALYDGRFLAVVFSFADESSSPYLYTLTRSNALKGLSLPSIQATSCSESILTEAKGSSGRNFLIAFCRYKYGKNRQFHLFELMGVCSHFSLPLPPTCATAHTFRQFFKLLLNRLLTCPMISR